MKASEERNKVGPFADALEGSQGSFYEGDILFELGVRVEGTFGLQSPVHFGTFCSASLPELTSLDQAGPWTSLGRDGRWNSGQHRLGSRSGITSQSRGMWLGGG